MDHDRHRASPIREQGRQFVDFVVSHPQVLVFRIVEQRLEGRIAAVRLAAFLLIKQNEPGQSYANGYRREERASTSRTLSAGAASSSGASAITTSVPATKQPMPPSHAASNSGNTFPASFSTSPSAMTLEV